MTEQMDGSRTPGMLGVRLDETDRNILRAVAEDARQSIRAISRQINLSPGAVQERLARLEQAGVITGYHAAVDAEKVGFGLRAIVGVQLEQGLPISETVERLISIAEVEAVFVVTGRWDLVLEIKLRDHTHLGMVVTEGIWGIPGFRHAETFVCVAKEAKPPHDFVIDE